MTPEIILWNAEHKVFATFLPTGSVIHPTGEDIFKCPGDTTYQRRTTRIYLEDPTMTVELLMARAPVGMVGSA